MSKIKFKKGNHSQEDIPYNLDLFINNLEKAQLDQIKAIYNQRLAAFNYLQTTGSLSLDKLK